MAIDKTGKARLEDLVPLEEQAPRLWSLLTRASVDKKSPWNRPAVATIGADGAPQVRTVILRACRPNARRLEFHTDSRSSKVVELRADNRLAWHFWDPGAQLQLRLSANADLKQGCDVAREAWSKLHPGSRQIYAQAQAPGTGISDPRTVRRFDDEFAFSNFVVVETEIDTMEMLLISGGDQRRAIFEWSAAASEWSGQWLAA